MAVVPLDEIVAVFAAPQAKSAVGRYVVHQIIIAWTVVVAAKTRELLPIHLHRRSRRATVNFLKEVRAAVANAVTVACNAVEWRKMGSQYARRRAYSEKLKGGVVRMSGALPTGC